MTDSQKLDYLIEKVSGIDGEIMGIKGEISEIKGDISEMKGNIRDLQVRMDKQENEIKYIKIFQENNLERGIKIIGEGHQDLNRKLNEALKILQS